MQRVMGLEEPSQQGLHIMGKVSAKWSQVVSRRTLNSQSKVYDTGTEKAGGGNIDSIMAQNLSTATVPL